ncbi:TniB protein [Variovorax sp. YR216]|nr:TniB protein [Variovorax sp. YR216]
MAASSVVSFGRLLPLLRPSPFGDKEMIQKLMAFSGGLTGRITTLLAQAAELAFREKIESISLELLERAAGAGVFKLPVEEEPDEANA